jgi:hypothetical protein
MDMMPEAAMNGVPGGDGGVVKALSPRPNSL